MSDRCTNYRGSINTTNNLLLARWIGTVEDRLSKSENGSTVSASCEEEDQVPIGVPIAQYSIS